MLDLKNSHVWSLRGQSLSLGRRTQTATRSISFDQLFCNTASDEEVESNCRFIPGKLVEIRRKKKDKNTEYM